MEAYAGSRFEWQAWIFAPLAGRQGHPGVGHLLGSFAQWWALGVLLGGPWTRWMPLPAATTRSGDLGVYERHSRGLTTLTELLGKGFGLWRKALGWALGVGRWVRGRVTPGALGVQILGVGCSRATTTRSPDGILCKASIYVVLKHPSRWRRDP